MKNVHSLTLVFFLFFTITISPPTLNAQLSDSYKFAGVWEQGTDGYALWGGANWTNFLSKWNEYADQNLRLVDIETYEENCQRYYNGVWRSGTDGYYLWAGVDWTSFVDKWNELAAQNLRLIDFETYLDNNGSRKYIGVWRSGTDGYYLWAGVDWTSFVDKWNELAAQNLRLIDIETYVNANGERRYTGVWRSGTDGYYLWAGVNWTNFVDKWTELAGQNLRLIDMETYENANGERKYTGVWRSGTSGYYLYADKKWDNFVSTWSDLASQGYRLVDLENYRADDNISTTAPSPNWECTFRTALDGKVAGYAYAIMKDGNFVAAGSHGYARAPWELSNPGVEMTINTEINFASVSKPIAAATLMTLIEPCDLDNTFWSYLSSMPQVTATPAAGVTSITLRQLLQMKSGLVQYSLWGDFWASINDVISQPLNATPGTTSDYNNANLSIIKAVIEQLSGTSFESYSQENVFAPMGITGMTHVPPSSTSAATTLSYPLDDCTTLGYAWPELTFSTAAGGWRGSVLDMVKFANGIRNYTVLSKERTEVLFDAELRWLRYGGTFGNYYWHNGGLHTGGNPDRGLSTAMVRLTDGYDAAIVMNGWYYDTYSTQNLIFDAFQSSCSFCANAGDAIQYIDCGHPSIQLDGSVSGNASYSWSTSDGNFLSGTSTLTPTINKAGKYTLTESSLFGCSASSSILVKENLTIALACNSTVTGHNNNGGNNYNTYSCASFNESGFEKIYALTTTDAQLLSLRLTNIQGGNLDLFLLSSCSENNCIAYSAGTGDESIEVELAANTTYYIIVDGANGASASYTLSNSCSPLAPSCDFPTGITSLVIGGNVARTSWSAAADATRYRIRYRPIGANWTEVLTGADETYRFLNGLSSNTNYEYQLKTLCSSSNSAWSASYYFTTATDICDIPDFTWHENLSTTSVTVNWSSDPGDIKYKLKYKPESGGIPWVEYIVNTTTKALTGLTPSTIYKYKLKTKCSGGYTQWSGIFNFTTGSSSARLVQQNNQDRIDFQLYPNPTSDYLTVNIEQENTEAIFIRNTVGKLLFSKTAPRFLEEINIQDWQAGIYFLTVKDKNQNDQTKSFVKIN